MPVCSRPVSGCRLGLAEEFSPGGCWDLRPGGGQGLRARPRESGQRASLMQLYLAGQCTGSCHGLQRLSHGRGQTHLSRAAECPSTFPGSHMRFRVLPRPPWKTRPAAQLHHGEYRAPSFPKPAPPGTDDKPPSTYSGDTSSPFLSNLPPGRARARLHSPPFVECSSSLTGPQHGTGPGLVCSHVAATGACGTPTRPGPRPPGSSQWLCPQHPLPLPGCSSLTPDQQASSCLGLLCATL